MNGYFPGSTMTVKGSVLLDLLDWRMLRMALRAASKVGRGAACVPGLAPFPEGEM